MRTVAGFSYCTSLPIENGRPSRKSAQPLNAVVDAPPRSDVSPPVNWNPPRGSFDACGWKWLMSNLLNSKPKRIECEPFSQLRFSVVTYWLSRNRNGFDTFGLPRLEKLVEKVKRG